MIGMLQQIDTNHNGQIDANEVQALGQRAGMVEAMIRRSGVEPKYPVKLVAIQEGLQKSRNNWNRGGGPNGPPGGFPGQPEGQDSSSKEDAKSTASTVQLVPGFGVEQKKASVPGFEVNVKTETAVAATSASGTPATTEAAANAGNSPDNKQQDKLDEKTRKFAESILKQNDKDHSGSLEKNKGEWDELRNAEAIDKDRNGVITLDEITAFYQAANNVRSPRKTPENKPVAAPVQMESPRTGGRPYRILSPMERLPEGLPDWFARNDGNGDGQISMSEFVREWTAEKAGEFARYDLNGDGIITPQEYLQSQKR
jgi:Ca2+-binding EF-hand superfamily protein